MKDREFLIWLHTRLERVYGDLPNMDYMCKLRAIIRSTPKDKYTPNVERSTSLEELEAELKTPNPCTAAAHLKPGEYQCVTNPHDGTVTLLLGRERCHARI